ncbi:MAG: cytochrome P450 [Hyphomicrobiales bacterium]|nr:cytochrome P450 [Hyphomicrobiales bacterium]
MDSAHTHAQTLGERESIWFKLTMLTKADQPIQNLVRMAEKYGGCIKINLRDERIFFLTDPAHFKHCLITHVDKYGKYFDGLTPIFGKSMITVDGALWQKIRQPQQPAFQPMMFTGYVPYLLSSVRERAKAWERFAETGESFNMLQETWTLAASMICKALFDRDMPFNPEVVFSAVKTYTDVAQHKDIRLRKVNGELSEVPLDESAADAIKTWISVPPQVLGAIPRDHREKTLMTMLDEVLADEGRPEFDRQQVLDEMKQYLWAGTETTALTLAWAFYLIHLHPEVGDRILNEGLEVYGDRTPNWQDLQNLHYTRAVIQETMRLYPPIWSFIREAVAEDEIAGRKVEPGDKMVLSSYVVHHSERWWPEPERFSPERFMPNAIRERQKTHPYIYMPFSLGKRSCIGGQLSIIENSLALTQLLRRFRPEYLGEVPARISATVTLTPENGALPFAIKT